MDSVFVELTGRRLMPTPEQKVLLCKAFIESGGNLTAAFYLAGQYAVYNEMKISDTAFNALELLEIIKNRIGWKQTTPEILADEVWPKT